MASPVAAESTRSKPRQKTLSHLEIHPALGGGVNVKHVYHQYEHEPRNYKFGPDEDQRALSHIARHAGLTGGEAAKEPEEEE